MSHRITNQRLKGAEVLFRVLFAPTERSALSRGATSAKVYDAGLHLTEINHSRIFTGYRAKDTTIEVGGEARDPQAIRRSCAA